MSHFFNTQIDESQIFRHYIKLNKGPLVDKAPLLLNDDQCYMVTLWL